ncbi:monovalent cation/H+ antiporter complex subunit F [Oceanitalea stevensii]|uniref:PH regulation protein F n=1 Tax=Oceanitalea stevensii TaxID=2763072 RepID=A0ABR8Z2I9_9MICO|nr:monovalent cation/H+ antiporter complex subunit F [Oceanitalea stevensii]MBD8062146.1 pH regulation protein F [Oceanitalea stevensii]
MTVVYVICFVILLAAALMALSRVERGPSMFDRILGVDVTTAVLIGTVAIIAAATKRGDLVPVLIVLALVGFIGSVSIARFAAAESAEEGRILTKDELEDILSQRDAAHEDGPDADEDEDSGSVIVSVEADDDEEHRRRDR